MTRLYNFSAGPSTLPLSVLETAQAELVNYHGLGMSIMEMSHRTAPFEAVLNEANERLRAVLAIPETHDVLWLQGGASLQFAMAPINLARPGDKVDVIYTGSWTKKAIHELEKQYQPVILASSEDRQFRYIPDHRTLSYSKDAAYTYITSNNTIAGTQWAQFPTTPTPLVVDMSSDILSRPLDIAQFGMIFAGAQKNMGPSGVTLVVVRKDLLDRVDAKTPSMLQYRTHSKANSLYNTPPTFALYVINLVLNWIQETGGLSKMAIRNQEKADLLYEMIENSPQYSCPIDRDSRSNMNVVFRIGEGDEPAEKRFVEAANQAGLSGLKGHRSVGGLRASIYNAMPREGVEALIAFMKTF